MPVARYHAFDMLIEPGVRLIPMQVTLAHQRAARGEHVVSHHTIEQQNFSRESCQDPEWPIGGGSEIEIPGRQLALKPIAEHRGRAWHKIAAKDTFKSVGAGRL